MLNPNENGYRPDVIPPQISRAVDKPIEQTEDSFARITNPNYYRKSEDQNVRDVINYSEMLKPEISVEEVVLTIPRNTEYEVAEKPTEIIIYQSSEVVFAD